MLTRISPKRPQAAIFRKTGPFPFSLWGPSCLSGSPILPFAFRFRQSQNKLSFRFKLKMIHFYFLRFLPVPFSFQCRAVLLPPRPHKKSPASLRGFSFFSASLCAEKADNINHDCQNKKANRNNLGPPSQERVNRPGLVLIKKRIRAAGYGTQILLMAFL